MKTKQELENIKEEIKNLNSEMQELSDDELENVTGGSVKLQLLTQIAAMAPSVNLMFLEAGVSVVQTETTGGTKDEAGDGLEAELKAELKAGVISY